MSIDALDFFFFSYFIQFTYRRSYHVCENYVHISGTLRQDKVWCNIFWFLRTEESDNQYLLQICPVSRRGQGKGENRSTRHFNPPLFNFFSFRNSRRLRERIEIRETERNVVFFLFHIKFFFFFHSIWNRRDKILI